jgi:glucokinase
MSKKRGVLAADIGGTKTALAVYGQRSGLRAPITHATFPSNQYPSLEAIVSAFLAGKNLIIENASVAVAGPVVGNRAAITNLPWVIDGQSLSQSLGGAPVRLLNDMEAIGHAIPYLEASDLETLNAGQPVEHGARAIVAPGTGLGEGFLVWSGGRYAPCPSEGGHGSFAPNSSDEMELWRYLYPRFGHVSCERVCSGLGIPNIYAFLKDSGRAAEPDWLRQELAAAADATPIIVQTGLAEKADICTKTLALFAGILAGEAGNLALKVLATGGVYLGGGIPPRIVPVLRTAEFMSSFTRKGRLGGLLAHAPVHVILKPDAGLFGAACHALSF